MKMSPQNNLTNTHCGKARCQLCNYEVADQHSTLIHSKYVITPGRFSHDPQNVFFFLICNYCSYVVETGTKFRLRFNNLTLSRELSVPFSNTQRGLKRLPVATHFARCNHSLKTLNFGILVNVRSAEQIKAAGIKLF